MMSVSTPTSQASKRCATRRFAQPETDAHANSVGSPTPLQQLPNRLVLVGCGFTNSRNRASKPARGQAGIGVESYKPDLEGRGQTNTVQHVFHRYVRQAD